LPQEKSTVKKTVTALAATAAVAAAGLSHADPLAWTKAWTYGHAATGVAGQTSEIVGFDAATQSPWVVGLRGVNVLGLSGGSLLPHVDTSAFGEANSVAIFGGQAAVAVAAPVKADPGSACASTTSPRGTFSAARPWARCPTWPSSRPTQPSCWWPTKGSRRPGSTRAAASASSTWPRAASPPSPASAATVGWLARRRG